MLTPKQKELFDLLKLPHGDESALRSLHATVRCIRGNENLTFTRWLQKCLKSMWRRENERSRPIYVGD